MTAPPPPPEDSLPDWQKSLQAATGETINLEVSPDNVLDIRKVMLTCAARMLKYGGGDAIQGRWVGECAQDPVSKLAAVAFNKRIAIMAKRNWEFGKQLKAAGDSLERIARDYGYTEEQIQASFKSITPDTQT
jgi:hypothetical protein